MKIEIYGKTYSIDEIECREVWKQHKYMDNQICKLTKLRYLNLSHNKIVVICKEIENLTKLKLLFLSSNLIEEMPPEIGKLVKLIYLYLGNNKIKVICKELGKLKQLRELTLNNNNIKETSTVIKRIRTLTYFGKPDNSNCKRISRRGHENIRCLFLINYLS